MSQAADQPSPSDGAGAILAEGQRGQTTPHPIGNGSWGAAGRILLYAARTALGLVFVLSGWLKANDPIGFALKLEDYSRALGHEPPHMMSLLVAGILLATMETTLGAMLALGLHKRLATAVATLFMLAMTALTVWLVVDNPVSDCGCFGDMVALPHTLSLAKNIALLALCAALLRWGAQLGSTAGRREAWMMWMPIALACIAYAAWCVHSLPRVDFRPYHVGADLPYLQSTGGTPGGGFDVKIVYQRNGQTLLLNADDDDPDSTWTYVETRSTPRTGNAMGISTWRDHQGDVAELWAIDPQGDDHADDILNAGGRSLIVTIPRMATADETCAGSLNLLYDMATEQGIAFHCLAATDSAGQRHWADYTGAEYNCLNADERTLWTMVRSNPGLILLEDGMVRRKWSSWTLNHAQDDIEKRLNIETTKTEDNNPSTL